MDMTSDKLESKGKARSRCDATGLLPHCVHALGTMGAFRLNPWVSLELEEFLSRGACLEASVHFALMPPELAGQL